MKMNRSNDMNHVSSKLACYHVYPSSPTSHLSKQRITALRLFHSFRFWPNGFCFKALFLVFSVQEFQAKSWGYKLSARISVSWVQVVLGMFAKGWSSPNEWWFLLGFTGISPLPVDCLRTSRTNPNHTFDCRSESSCFLRIQAIAQIQHQTIHE